MASMHAALHRRSTGGGVGCAAGQAPKHRNAAQPAPRARCARHYHPKPLPPAATEADIPEKGSVAVATRQHSSAARAAAVRSPPTPLLRTLSSSRK
eukprot:170401-Chlamydomonas_euryale.AAC.4